MPHRELKGKRSSFVEGQPEGDSGSESNGGGEGRVAAIVVSDNTALVFEAP